MDRLSVFIVGVLASVAAPSLASATLHQAFGHGPTASDPSAMLIQNTRSDREEIERQIDNAPQQKSPSIPTDRYEMKTEPGDMPAELKVGRDWLWAGGGWARGTFTTFDTFGQDRSLFDYDLRVWSSLHYTSNHQVYGRLRSFYTRYHKGDSPSGDETNWQDLRVDQIFWEADWARSLGWDKQTDLTSNVGRQFFFMGKGLVLSNVLEGARLNFRHGNEKLEVIAARSMPLAPDFDPTLPTSRSESKRAFFGAIFHSSYDFNDIIGGLVGRWYLYGLMQQDNNDLDTATQAYAYDSYYVGLGSDGTFPINAIAPFIRADEFGYSAELSFQFGKGGSDGSADRASIFGYAFLGDLYWLPGNRLPWQSRAVFSYYFASGDQDRGTPLGTVSGNRVRTDDNAYNYFGYAVSGYSLAPRLTNMHMGRVNFESLVVDDKDQIAKLIPVIRTIKVGAAGYLFLKHHHDAPISDFTSIEHKRYIGSEADFYLDWSMASDLDISLRYGAFFPGAAYEFKDTRHFFSLAANLSF